MKVVVPTNDNSKASALVLPSLIEGSTTPLTKDNSVGLNLRVDPADANSVTFKLQVLVLNGSEKVRDYVNWKRDIE